jgi:hypothetical protein
MAPFLLICPDQEPVLSNPKESVMTPTTTLPEHGGDSSATPVTVPGAAASRPHLASIDYHPHAVRDRKVEDVLLALRAGCSIAVDPGWIVPPLDPVAQAAVEGDALFERTFDAVASRPQAPLVVVAECLPRVDIDLGESPRPFKLVAGSFVLYACLRLKRPVGVTRCQDAMLVSMVSSLRARSPRSGVAAIEWGALFRRALSKNLYRSQTVLAEAIEWPRSTVQRAVKLASLPDPVIKAFQAPHLLRLHDAEPINQALEANEAATIVEAQALSRLTPRPDRTEVLRRLRVAAGLPPATPQD